MPKKLRPKITQRIWKSFSRSLIEFAEHLPSAKKGVLAWLQNVRREERFFRNEKPNHIEVSLSSIWVCSVIPIEDFQDQAKSVVQILGEYKSKRFLDFVSSRNRELLESLYKFKEGSSGSSWHNIGILDFENSSIKEQVDYAHFEVQVFDGSFVSLIFHITPGKASLSKIRALVNRNVSESLEIYPPKTFKSLFRGWWGGKSRNESHYKLQLIQTEIQNIKDEFKKELRRFFSGYFLNMDEFMPSLELWTFKQTQCPYEEKSRLHERFFWESLGMDSGGTESYSTISFKQFIFLAHPISARLVDKIFS